MNAIQTALFGEPTARRTDPLTSHLAAASVGAGLEPLILEALAEYGDQNADELCARVPGYPPSIKSAISRLRHAGDVEDSGERRLSERGRQQIVWALHPRGRPTEVVIDRQGRVA